MDRYTGCLDIIEIMLETLCTIHYNQSINQSTILKALIDNKWNMVQNSTLSQTSPGFYMSVVEVFWKQCGKRIIARNKQFFFPMVFSTLLENFLPFLSSLKLLSANTFNLEESKTCHLGKGQWWYGKNVVGTSIFSSFSQYFHKVFP